MHSRTISLSVVIPAYNEEANFRAGVLDPVLEFLHRQDYAWELLFVDDGSTDDTYQLLSDLSRQESRVHVLHIPHGGKAAAVTAGMLAARGDIILFTDFDQSTPLDQVQKFLAAHQAGADVVIGHRVSTLHDTLVRRLRSWTFVTFVQIIALPGISDTQCGFKSFTKVSARKVFSSLKVCLPKSTVAGSYMGAFDVEALFLARKFGFFVKQVPVTWIKIASDRLNIWKEPLKMAIDTLTIRIWDILDLYGQSTAH